MFDRRALKAALEASDTLDFEALTLSHPALFSPAALYISPATLQAMAGLVVAIASVIALPAYHKSVLAWAPASAQKAMAARSVFFGYDFHLAESGPQLIAVSYTHLDVYKRQS